MPVRMLREGILTSEKVDLLSPCAEVFYRRLMSVVDDYGRYDANPKLLRSACFPLKDKLEANEILPWLQECIDAGLILFYRDKGKDYVQIENFGQQIRAKKSKFPEPQESVSNCLADAKQIPATAHLVGVGVGDVDEVEDGGVGISSSDTSESSVPDAPTPPRFDEIQPTRAGQISLLMRQNGIEGCNAAHPVVQAWAADARVTDDLLLTAASMVKARNANRPGPNYVKPIIEQLLDPPKPKPSDDWHRSDAGIRRKAAEMGVRMRGGESYSELKDRIFEAIRRAGVTA